MEYAVPVSQVKPKVLAIYIHKGKTNFSSHYHFMLAKFCKVHAQALRSFFPVLCLEQSW